MIVHQYKMNKSYLIKNHLNGRSIFKKVIPTVNTLKNMFRRLDEINWNTNQLKKWEKPIYKAYLIDELKAELINVRDDERKIIVKNHLLNTDTYKFGSHPICVYLMAYYINQSNDPSLIDFKNFCIENEISDKENSASAIWNVGTSDGKFLDLFDDDLNIVDFDFFINWSKSDNQLTSNSIDKPVRQEIEIKNHLNYFLNLKEEIDVFRGTNSLKWSIFVCGNKYKYPEIFNQNLYRDDLLNFCNSKSTSDILALLAVLSWGGMNRKHGKSLLSDPATILEIVNKLRNNYFHSRKDAFEYIHQKRDLNLLPGLGIGYYTKLICFLAPNLNGYIMDQWLAKSINLISDKKLIHIANDWVTNQNTSLIYEEFCSKIDDLSKQINESGYKTEEKLFSIGGRKKGKWRQYVIDNYK